MWAHMQSKSTGVLTAGDAIKEERKKRAAIQWWDDTC